MPPSLLSYYHSHKNITILDWAQSSSVKYKHRLQVLITYQNVPVLIGLENKYGSLLARK